MGERGREGKRRETSRLLRMLSQLTIHARDDGDLDQSDSSEGVKKWLGSGFTTKVSIFKLF